MDWEKDLCVCYTNDIDNDWVNKEGDDVREVRENYDTFAPIVYKAWKQITNSNEYKVNDSMESIFLHRTWSAK